MPFPYTFPFNFDTADPALTPTTLAVLVTNGANRLELFTGGGNRLVLLTNGANTVEVD